MPWRVVASLPRRVRAPWPGLRDLGHLSDGNLHPNLVPGSLEDVVAGRDAVLEIGRGVVTIGGAPLAEHGVGRSPLKQRLLRELYGEAGIAGMRAVKRVLDPTGKLSPGVLFP